MLQAPEGAYPVLVAAQSEPAATPSFAFQNGILHSGDELLEVNGRKLLGLYHTDVVAILKDLPMNVRLVCARSRQTAAQTDLVRIL